MEWLVDPMPCVRRTDPHKQGCIVLAGRDQVMSGKLTKLAVTEEREGRQWAHGHISAQRRDDGVYLAVNTSGNHAIETPRLSSQDALHAADVLRAAAGNATALMCAGKSLHEILWDELMTIMDRLMTGCEAEDGRDPGRAEGVAYCIAIFQNPYAPNIEGVRAEAMERWDQQEAELAPRKLSRAAAVQVGARAARRARHAS